MICSNWVYLNFVYFCSFRRQEYPRLDKLDINPRLFLTHGLDSGLNCHPVSYFNVDVLPIYIASTRGCVTHEGVKIQQRTQFSTAKGVIIQRKIHWILTPGSVSNGGSKFYLAPEKHIQSDSSCGTVLKILKTFQCIDRTLPEQRTLYWRETEKRMQTDCKCLYPPETGN